MFSGVKGLSCSQARHRRFRSWEAAVTDLEHNLPQQVRVLSIDVFDTLVFRHVHADLVARGTVREFERRLQARGFRPQRDVATARDAAVRLVAARTVAAGGEPEARLEDTVLAWIALVLGAGAPDEADLARTLVQFEVSQEMRAVTPNRHLVEWLRRERGRGRRVVFCSDMHLGSPHLRNLFASVGCDGLFDAGYVSAEVGVSKRHGRLFAHLLAMEQVDRKELLHIGDSVENDGWGANAARVASVVVQDPEAQRRVARALFDRDCYRRDGHWAGVVAATYSSREPEPATPEERFGRATLGPLFSACMHKAAEVCRDRSVRQVYFLSREGLVLKALFEEMQKPVWREQPGPCTTYLGISRATAMLAATRTLGLQEISTALTNHPFPTLRRLLAPFGVPEDVIRRVASLHGLPGLDDRLPDWFRDWPPLLRMLETDEVLSHVHSAASVSRRQLGAYLTQERFFEGGRVALVDVGWGGLIQDSLWRGFGSDPGFPDLVGLYVGLDQFGRSRTREQSGLKAILGAAESPEWHGGSVALFKPGLEVMLRAPHGTVTGHVCGPAATVVPVLREGAAREAEKVDEPRLALMQAGMLWYGRKYAECAVMLAACADEMLPYAKACVDRLMRYPEPREARWLFSMTSVCDLGLNEVRRLGDDAEVTAPPWFWRRLRSQLRGSPWRHGSVTLSAGRWLRHLWVAWWATHAPVDAGTPCTWAASQEPDLAGHVPLVSAGGGMGAGSETWERAAWCRWASLVEEGKHTVSRDTSPNATPLDLEYAVMAAVTRRLVNLSRRRAGRPVYVPDGVSHLDLIKRHAATSRGIRWSLGLLGWALMPLVTRSQTVGDARR